MFDDELKQIELNRLTAKVLQLRGIDLDKLEFAVHMVSCISGILGREFETATNDYMFFLWGYRGTASIQLNLHQSELMLMNNPKIGPRTRSILAAYADAVGLKLIEYKE